MRSAPRRDIFTLGRDTSFSIWAMAEYCSRSQMHLECSFDGSREINWPRCWARELPLWHAVPFLPAPNPDHVAERPGHAWEARRPTHPAQRQSVAIQANGIGEIFGKRLAVCAI